MDLCRGKILRQIINLAPRHGKTVFIAQHFPFYYLGLFPDRDVIYASATKTLAEEQGEMTRDLIETHGPSLFGISVSRESSAKDNWDICDARTGRPTGGSMRCFGVNSSVHGRNAHLLILDDLVGSIKDAVSPTHRNTIHRVYTSSLYTRLAPNGAVVSIGTPTHSDDWFGRMQKAEDEGGDKWDRLKLRALAPKDDPLGREEGEALWPERWTKTLLEATRDNLRANGQFRDWRAQYDLECVSGDGVSEWPENYFTDIMKPHDIGKVWTSVMAVDVSKGARSQKKGDWQAFAFLQAGEKGVRVQCQLHRLNVADLLNKSQELFRLWNPGAIVIETNNAGYTLFENLLDKRHHGLLLPVFGRNHGGMENKVMRITQRLGTALESGVLHFDKTPHNQLVIDQARVFPNGDYDDGIDAIEMGLEFIGQLKLPKDKRLVNYQSRNSLGQT